MRTMGNNSLMNHEIDPSATIDVYYFIDAFQRIEGLSDSSRIRSMCRAYTESLFAIIDSSGPTISVATRDDTQG